MMQKHTVVADDTTLKQSEENWVNYIGRIISLLRITMDMLTLEHTFTGKTIFRCRLFQIITQPLGQSVFHKLVSRLSWLRKLFQGYLSCSAYLWHNRIGMKELASEFYSAAQEKTSILKMIIFCATRTLLQIMPSRLIKCLHNTHRFQPGSARWWLKAISSKRSFSSKETAWSFCLCTTQMKNQFVLICDLPIMW